MTEDYPPLSLTVPEPEVRPGGTPDFSKVPIPRAGTVRRPEVDADPEELRDLAFTIIDAYQGKGVGTLLLHHLTAIAKEAGLRQFVAEVLSENAPMLKLFEKSGLPMSVQREADIVHVTLDL